MIIARYYLKMIGSADIAITQGVSVLEMASFGNYQFQKIQKSFRGGGITWLGGNGRDSIRLTVFFGVRLDVYFNGDRSLAAIKGLKG
jgi:hypothetical protein